MNQSQEKHLLDNSTSITGVAAKQPFMATVRELVWAYQSFRSYSDTQIRQMGLTSSQFDIISTLGNTSGLTFNKLAEKTLTTKTVLGMVDRTIMRSFYVLDPDRHVIELGVDVPQSEWAHLSDPFGKDIVYF